MGDTGLPPEKPEGYKTDGAVALLAKAGVKDAKIPDEVTKEFNAWAHDAKLSQAQYDKALVAYLSSGKDMVDQAFDKAIANGKAELVKVWGADGADPKSPQMQAAYRAFMTYAPAAYRTPEQMDKIGSHPIVLQVLAAVGKEMGEDKRIHGEGAEGDNIGTLMKTEAYWNKKHAEHASTVKKVNEYFARGGKAPAKAA